MSQPDKTGPPDVLRITDTQIQKRSRSARRSVFINGEFAFGLSEETFTKFALYKGTVVTAEFIEQVHLGEQIYQAKQAAMRMFNKRLRSTREVEMKLREKKFPPEAIQQAIAFLNEYGMLNDAQFASSFVNDKLLRKPIGKSKLKMALREKGIGKDEAEAVVAQAVSEERELLNALHAAERRSASRRIDDVQKWERSLVNFLQTRGFGWDVIRKTVKTLKEQWIVDSR